MKQEHDAKDEAFDPVLIEQRIHNVDIEHEMKRSFLDYSMSVIVSRALPDCLLYTSFLHTRPENLHFYHRFLLFNRQRHQADAHNQSKQHKRDAINRKDLETRPHNPSERIAKYRIN